MNNVASDKGFELHKFLIHMYQDNNIIVDRNTFLKDNIEKYFNTVYPSLLLSYHVNMNNDICIGINIKNLNSSSIKDIICTLRTIFSNCIVHLFDVYPNYKNQYMKQTRMDEIEFRNNINYMSFYACNILSLSSSDKDVCIFVMNFID